MAITFVSGSMFNQPKHVWLVNTVNCGYQRNDGTWVGTMGAGLAAQFATKYPALLVRYNELCASRSLKPGMCFPWQGNGGRILNVATKDHFRDPSRIEWVESILQGIVSNYERLGITAIALPKLGCGLGKLSWNEVCPMMVAYLDSLPIEVFIYGERV